MSRTSASLPTCRSPAELRMSRCLSSFPLFCWALAVDADKVKNVANAATGASRQKTVWNRVADRDITSLLDVALLAAESHPDDGEVGAFAFGIDGNDVLVVIGAGLQFYRLATVVRIALEITSDDVALFSTNHGDIVVDLETPAVALQHVAVFLELVLVESDDFARRIVRLVLEGDNFQAIAERR